MDPFQIAYAFADTGEDLVSSFDSRGNLLLVYLQTLMSYPLFTAPLGALAGVTTALLMRRRSIEAHQNHSMKS